MTHTAAIKTMMKSRGMHQSTLGKHLNLKQSAVARNINEDSLRLLRFLRIAEACGYELVLQPATQGKRREGQLVLRSGDYEGSGDTE